MLVFSYFEEPWAKPVQFSGFCHYRHAFDFQSGYQVVVAWHEDDAELWLIESNEGMENLRKFYAEVWKYTHVDFVILDRAP